MLKNIVFIFLLFIVNSSFAQENVTDNIKITSDGKTLTIQINDERANKYGLLIYKTHEDIKVNEVNITINPYKIDISNWEPSVYHIKIDYARETLFRRYEIIK